MNKTKYTLLLMALSLGTTQLAKAQFGKVKINSKTVSAAEKGVSAAAYSDADAARDAKAAVAWMDEHNSVAGPNDPYTIRLNKIFGKHKNEDGLTLNYKVYKVTDINAFACADGSVRVFSALMDMMTDAELLAIIGHEIGHVKNHDSRDAMKAALKRAAISDAASSQSGVVNTLSESQLGALAESIMDSKHSRKQESEADDYSYDLMKKYNYNVVGGYTAFMKFVALEGDQSKQSKYAKMFSSHPDSRKRAETMKEKAEKDGLWKEPVEEKKASVPAKKK